MNVLAKLFLSNKQIYLSVFNLLDTYLLTYIYHFIKHLLLLENVLAKVYSFLKSFILVKKSKINLILKKLIS